MSLSESKVLGCQLNWRTRLTIVFFEDSMGRFHITVPAVEVTSGRAYTCDITNEDIAYDGVQSGKIRQKCHT